MKSRILIQTLEEWVEFKAITTEQERVNYEVEFKIPIQSFHEFVQLLTLTDKKDRLKLVADYGDTLATFFNSIDDMYFNLRQLSAVDSSLQKEVLRQYPQIFLGAFKSVGDIKSFSERARKEFEDLLYNRDSAFRSGLFSLFKTAGEVLQFVQNCRPREMGYYGRSYSMAEQLFSYEVPHAGRLTSEYYGLLRQASSVVALSAAMSFSAQLAASTSISSAELFNLASLHVDLPRKHEYHGWSSDRREGWSDDADYYAKTGDKIELGEHLFEQFKKIIGEPGHVDAIAFLLEKANYIKFYNINGNFARALLERRTLMAILFKDGLILEGLKELYQVSYPLFALFLEKYPNEVAALFHSTSDIKNFAEDVQHFCPLMDKFPKAALQRIANLFIASEDIVDWEWLAKTVAKENHSESSYRLTNLAARVLKRWYIFDEDESKADQKTETPSKIATVFSSAAAITRVAGASPGFARDVIDVLKEELNINPKTFFADPEALWLFLQNGGTHWILIHFSLDICETDDVHIAHIFQRSNHFASLEPKFAAALLGEPSWGPGYHYGIHSKVIKVLEASDSNLFVLSHYPGVLNAHDITGNPRRLIGFAKTADDLVALVASPLFKAEQNWFGHFTNKKLEEYIISAECCIPDRLLTFAEPANMMVRLAQANWRLMSLLITHHTDKLLPIINYQSFVQLPFAQQYHFAEKAPERMVELFASPSANLKDLSDVLKKCEAQYNNWERKPVFAMVTKYPAIFAAIVKSGTVEERVTLAKTYPDFISTLLDHSPELVAQAFSGDAFMALMVAEPVFGRTIMEKCLSFLAILIPTQAHFESLQQKRSMLIRLISNTNPAAIEALTKFYAQPKVASTEVPSLPSVGRAWSSLLAVKGSSAITDQEEQVAAAPEQASSMFIGFDA